MPTTPSPSLSKQSRILWAKTGSGEDATQWEPLYVHMLDAAQTAELIWRDYLAESTKRVIASGLGLSLDDARRVVAFIVGVHDIGKATPPFQFQQRELWEHDLETGLSGHIPRERCPHAVLSQEILLRWLEERRPSAGVAAAHLAAVIGGHHGAYPSPGDVEDVETFASELLGDSTWAAVQRELLDALAGVYLDDALLDRLLSSTPQVFVGVLLTAVVIMADWIASNTELFPLTTSVDSMDGLRRRAGVAWQRLGLPKALRLEPDGSPLDELFHLRFTTLPAGARPNSVQRAVHAAARQANGPALMVIEAPMGCGKTEASLLAAEAMAGECGQSGFAYLLPTQATSNAMFSRMEEWMGNLLHDSGAEGPQDLHLLHGKAALDEGFRALPVWRPSSMGDGPAPAGRGGDALVAHQWFGGRKRGLLANTVVGTVDQLLMAALKARHVQLRHLGLAGKVVVIDEVHAYDAYMSVYLRQALYFLGTYGVPVVLLSATLPPERKQSLIDAYEGRVAHRRRPPRGPEAPMPDHPDPAVTLSRGKGEPPLVVPCEDAGTSRDYAVEWLDDGDEALVRRLREALADGGCACVVRDTVARAQYTYDLLRESLDVPVVLAHSRFIAIDRARRDAELLELLGRDGHRPRSYIVVGTQVVEQSLDIDFDVMVSDIAPVDLVLQRMGRLHRHRRGPGEQERPPALREARCILTGAAWDADPPVFSRGVALEGGAGVYEAALLYRTVLAIRERVRAAGSISLPGDIAPLVDEVYGFSDARVTVPVPWRQAYDEAVRKYREHEEEREQRAEAWRLSRFGRRQRAGLTGWMDRPLSLTDDTGRQAVRDGGVGVEVVLLQRVDGGLRLLPWVAAGQGVGPDLVDESGEPVEEACRVAATCTVALPDWVCADAGLVRALEECTFSSGLADSPWLQGCLVAGLDGDGVAEFSSHQGKNGSKRDKGTIKLKYTRNRGLEVFHGTRD